MKPTINKKFSLNLVLSILPVVIGLVAMIIYGVNVARGGYFNGAAVPEVVAYGVWGLIVLTIAAVLNIVRFSGIVGKVTDMLGLALKVLGALFFAFALIYLIQARAEGLSYIFFSNQEIIEVLQKDPDNMISAGLAIASIIIVAITVIVACVNAFFGYKSEEAAPATEAEA